MNLVQGPARQGALCSSIDRPFDSEDEFRTVSHASVLSRKFVPHTF